ncbi:hypothetical protein ASD11_15500 [Aeromicrobium sp. Root495]|uniref:rhomboid family intramembrane serine protease n=1 Tax=Aeromicrobium sp. Root495 TaxID=1736550 RepID=UPI000700DC8D|nr:rhomboid family intramembrane serine protease [Aeromicrobium sp. Root495]KQY55897.1 hypothetical protein ASD11_15500 [Aeromicrobium sp. Root495]
MRDASVGFQCPSCIAEGAKTVRVPRTRAGAVAGVPTGAVTTALIVVNVVAYLLVDGLRLTDVKREGVLTAGGIYQHEYWRLLTSAFLHYGPLHLLLNMLALYLFGTYVEQVLGTWRYLATYLLTAVTASAVVYLLAPVGVQTAGASGAISGLFAIAFLLALRAGQDVRSFLVLIVINVVLSARDGVSWEAHLGGFVAGAILGAAFAYAPRTQRALWQGAAFGALVLGSLAMIAWRTQDISQTYIFAG